MEKQKQKDDHRKILFSWQTPEFIAFSRGRTWYIVAGIFMAGIITYAILSGSITMALAFLMVCILFMLIQHKQPRLVDVIISDMGIQYDRTFYPFHHINAFWIVYHPPYIRSLYLRISEGKRFKIVHIQLDAQSPIVIREILIKEIPEIEGAEEPLIDTLIRVLRLH